ALLLRGQPIKGVVEVILSKALEPQGLSDSVLSGPADRREARALGGDTRHNEQQDEFGPAFRAEHLEQADALGQLLERKQHGEDRATDGLQLPRQAIELALEGPAESLDALRRPRGQVGEGPCADLVPIAEGFPQGDGRRGVAIGNGGDIHEYLYIRDWVNRKEEIIYLHDYAIKNARGPPPFRAGRKGRGPAGATAEPSGGVE